MKLAKHRLFWSLFAFVSIAFASQVWAASSWNLQINTTDPTLYGVYAVSDTVLTAVGSEGVVTKSTDRGVTWSPSTIGGTTYTWYGAIFPTSLVGYIAGTKSDANCYIYKTTNGGTSWSQNHTNGVTEVFFDIYFADDKTGWAVGRNVVSPPVRVYRTTNGTDWSTTSLNWSSRAYGVHAVLDGVAYSVWVVGEGGRISKSTDGGVGFSEQTSGTANTLFDVFFFDKNTGWIVGAGGTILATTNGGTNWTAQTSGITSTLYGVHFVSATTGFAVGAGGVILSTTNGGSTWTAQTSGTTANLYRVYFYDSGNGWAVGGNSRVALKYGGARVDSINPAFGQEGTAGSYTITGAHFQTGATLAFSGSGITPSSVSIDSPTQITCTLTIASDAGATTRDLTITNGGDGIASTSSGVFLVQSTGSNPTVTSASPSLLRQSDSNKDVVITGTGFKAGATVTFSFNGITINSTTVNSSTQITINVSISSSSVPGTRSITVRNTDGAGIGSNIFTIQSSSVTNPTITSVVSDIGYQGTSGFKFMVNGTGFLSGASALFSSTGVIAGSVEYLSATQLRVTVNIAADAAVGKRSITITNTNTGIAILDDAFEVKAVSTSGKKIQGIAGGPNPLTSRVSNNFSINFEVTRGPFPFNIEMPLIDISGRMIGKWVRTVTQPGLYKTQINFSEGTVFPGNGTHILGIIGPDIMERYKVVFAR